MKIFFVIFSILIGLFIVGFIYDQNVSLKNKLATQEKQIEACKVYVTETDKERDEKAKKFDALIADLKDWANKNQSSMTTNQYQSFIDCDSRIGGGFSCFRY